MFDFSTSAGILYALYAQPLSEDDGITVSRDAILLALATLERTVRQYHGSDIEFANAGTTLAKLEQPVFTLLSSNPYRQTFAVGELCGKADATTILKLSAYTPDRNLNQFVNEHCEQIIQACELFMNQFLNNDDIAVWQVRHFLSVYAYRSTDLAWSCRGQLCVLMMTLCATSSVPAIQSFFVRIFDPLLRMV